MQEEEDLKSYYSMGRNLKTIPKNRNKIDIFS